MLWGLAQRTSSHPPRYPRIPQCSTHEQRPQEGSKRDASLDRGAESRASRRSADKHGKRDPATKPENGSHSVDSKDSPLVRGIS